MCRNHDHRDQDGLQGEITSPMDSASQINAMREDDYDQHDDDNDDTVKNCKIGHATSILRLVSFW